MNRLQKVAFMEEKINLQGFHSATALKDEIGRRILDRSKTDWAFVDLKSRGSYLYLTFKQEDN